MTIYSCKCLPLLQCLDLINKTLARHLGALSVEPLDRKRARRRCAHQSFLGSRSAGVVEREQLEGLYGGVAVLHCDAGGLQEGARSGLEVKDGVVGWRLGDHARVSDDDVDA